MQKKIVRDTFRKLLPDELYTRKKHGFDVPLQKWFRNELRSMITDDLLADPFIREQNLFNPEAISMLKKKMFSSNPGESVEQIWALVVFQYWWKRYMKI